jgi:hypothetical protein
MTNAARKKNTPKFVPLTAAQKKDRKRKENAAYKKKIRPKFVPLTAAQKKENQRPQKAKNNAKSNAVHNIVHNLITAAKRKAELEEKVAEIRKRKLEYPSTDVYVHKDTGLIQNDTHSLEFADPLTPAEMKNIRSAALNTIQDFVKKQPSDALLYVYNSGEHRSNTESTQNVKIKIRAGKTPKLAAHSSSVKAFEYDHEVDRQSSCRTPLSTWTP